MEAITEGETWQNDWTDNGEMMGKVLLIDIKNIYKILVKKPKRDYFGN
jgi:hypothetical protein